MVNKIKVHVARALAVTVIAGLTVSIPVDVKAGVGQKSIDGTTIKAKSNTNGHDVKLAMDGDKKTYWESSNHYRWVEIDLGATYSLSAIKVFNKIGGYYHYNIYASSDGENFIKVGAKENDNIATIDGDNHQLGNMNATKIRIDVTYSSENNNSNIAEIELYGNKVSDDVAEESKIETTNFKGSKWEEEYNKFSTDIEYANSKTIQEMSNMVGRVIGEEYKDKFIFEIREKTSSDTDVFEVLDGEDGKILIKGNNGVSLASGFNYYLKNYAKVMYNPLMGSNLNMPEKLPSVGERIVIDTPYEERYALNFCTYSYTMSFWDWDEYEAFLDWSAMNGYNLMLDIVGQEEVLRRTLNEFNYSDEEVKEFISGPAYFAWFYMQNMTSFGGPLPDNWFEDRTELGRQLHDRMQTLGIKPVLQGYSGMVPLDFKTKNPDAQILSQGEWCGFNRPNMLRTYVNSGQEDYFQKVADVFYEKQNEVFGNITNYYAVDPFHEGGNTGDLNNGKIYGTIQKKMIDKDEDAIWVIQHWQGNPNNAKLEGLYKKEQTLILDLNSDLNPDFNRFDNQDIPWIWNMLHNFGGRMGLDGQVERVSTQITEALATTEHMKGIGITPEALANSPVVYELMGDMIWRRDPINYTEWINNYIERRYGAAVNEKTEAAWELLLETAYKKSEYYYQGAPESVINARPAMTINSASTWGHSKINYDKKKLEEAMQLFIECYDELKDSDAFVYDFLDLTKQVLANSAQEYHKEMVAAYNSKNTEKFEKVSEHFLDLIRLQEKVLSTSPEFLVGTWIEQSRTMLKDADDWTKDLFEFNARALITTWGDYKNGGLKDYSNRQWAGLTEDLYLKRWEMWIDGLRNELKTGTPAPNINWHKVEYEWATEKTTENNKYTTEGSGEDLGKLAKEAMEQFSVTNMEKFLGGASEAVEKINIAKGKKVTSSVETNSKYPTTNLTDGTTGTAWMAQKVEWPVTLTLDLEKVYSIDGIAFAPNQAAGGLDIDYTVQVMENGQWKDVIKKVGEKITGTISVDYKGNTDKVRLVLDSKDVNLVPEITEIMVYESQGENQGEKVEYENIALGKPVTVPSSQAGHPASNITDGKLETIWINNGEGIGSEVKVDLQKSEYVEKLELSFEQSGLPFQFKVEADGVVLLDMTDNKETLKRTYTIDVNKEIKDIIITITGKNGQGALPGAWASLAEVKALRPVQEYENIALGKPATATSTESADKSASNVTDGKLNTIWVANGKENNGGMGSSVTVDLEAKEYVENIELSFEEAGRPFQFEVKADGEVIWDMTKNDKPLEKTYTINVDKEIKEIEVKITGKYTSSQVWASIAEIKALRPVKENVELVNVAEGKEVTGSTAQNGKPLSNITDGNVGTWWIADGGKLDSHASVNLGRTYFAENIELYFEKAGLPFKFKVETIDANGNRKTVLDKTKNEEVLEHSYNIPVKADITNVVVTFNGKAVVGSAQGAWPAIAEIKVNAKETIDQSLQASVKIPQSTMKAKASSEHPNVGTEGLAEFAIDGQNGTIWHTKYSPKEELPQDITLELDGEYIVNKYSYIPRNGGGNGTITKYEIQLSTDGKEFTTVAKGTWEANSDEKIVTFEGKKATHVRLKALEGVGGFASAAELNVFAIPENIAKNDSTTVTANTNKEAVNNVKDNNENTVWSASGDEDKIVEFDLGTTKDISAIEILKASGEALKYRVEYSKDGEVWIQVADRSKNKEDYNNYVEQFKETVIAQHVKVTLLNKDVNISEIKIYKGNATEPLSRYINTAQGIYKAAVVGDMAGNYTKEAKDKLGAAIAKANEELAKDPDSSKVQELIAELKKEVSNFRRSAVSVNRIKLAALISDVDVVLNSLNKARIAELTEEQRNIVEGAIENLRSEKAEALGVYETVKVGQSQIDTAHDELKDALDNYLEVADEQSKYEAVLAIAKEKIENAVVGSGNGQYTKEAVDSLKSAIETAEADFSVVIDVAGIADITSKLQVAVDAFKANVVEVNKAALDGAIKDAEEELKVSEGVKKPSAIEEFRLEVEAAKNVLNNPNSSQQEIDSAVEALSIAKAEFDSALIVNKNNLTALVENANGLIEDLKVYTDTTELVSEIEAIIKETELLINNDNATTEEVDTQVKKLSDLIAKGQSRLDELENSDNEENPFKENLKIAIEEALKITDEELGVLNEEVVKEFRKALAKAKEVLSNTEATQDEIYDSIDRLNRAMEILNIKNVDKEQLISLVERINLLDEDKYIKGQWKQMQAVLVISNDIIKNEDVSEMEIIKNYNSLLRAFLKLRLKPNKDILRALINKVNNLNAINYTEESWSALQSELANDKIVMADEAATAEEIANSEKALQKAIDNLVAKTEDDNITNNTDKVEEKTNSSVSSSGSNTTSDKSSTNSNSKLPNTGGRASSLVALFGGILAAGGALLGRRNKR